MIGITSYVSFNNYSKHKQNMKAEVKELGKLSQEKKWILT